MLLHFFKKSELRGFTSLLEHHPSSIIKKNTHRTTDYQQYKQKHHYLTHNNNSSNQKDIRTKEPYDYINMTKIQPELIICPKCSVVIATNPSNICLLFFLSIPTFSLIRKIMIYALLFIHILRLVHEDKIVIHNIRL